MIVSMCLHLIVIGALLYRPNPVILKHLPSLRGDGGGGQNTVVLVAPGASVISFPGSEEVASSEPLALRRAQRRKSADSKPRAAVPESGLKPGMPGFMLGSLSSGYAIAHDVRVALPVIAPDPPIVRAKLPEWIRGDVIVEVTIDEQGHVVETIVLQTVGFGLEDTIVETLRRWHFTPATVDGVAVASKQDVHYHFPS
ncbi:MAG TPA: energy transducer TonB [Clostridia bacterium]|nr:energy transducer TonB [Clostridia bacterium]